MANIVITGANRGIGLALAKLYEARGDSVTAVCRETNDEIEEIADQVLSDIDITNEEQLPSIAMVLDRILDDPIDVLINNAALYYDQDILDQSNHLAPRVLVTVSHLDEHILRNRNSF